jgi:hypothetical protein
VGKRKILLNLFKIFLSLLVAGFLQIAKFVNLKGNEKGN